MIPVGYFHWASKENCQCHPLPAADMKTSKIKLLGEIIEGRSWGCSCLLALCFRWRRRTEIQATGYSQRHPCEAAPGVGMVPRLGIALLSSNLWPAPGLFKLQKYNNPGFGLSGRDYMVRPRMPRKAVKSRNISFNVLFLRVLWPFQLSAKLTSATSPDLENVKNVAPPVKVR